MRNNEQKLFKSGTHNKIDSESIPADAASSSENWVTKDGRIKLVYGKSIVGTDGGAGTIQGEIFGYKVDGTKVHWRKTGTVIQYYDGSAWQNVVTGLTNSADYVFANYSSLAGSFTFAFGIDGIYKFHNANPTSYVSLYNEDKNWKGYALIDKGRAFLWGRSDDKTGLYASRIDTQTTASGVYTMVTAESLGSSGSTSYTPTLTSATAQRNCFAIQVYAGYGSSKTVSAITKAANAQITASSHGYVVGDKLVITGVSGMTEINGKLLTVASVVDSNNFTVSLNTTSYSNYTSGGSSYKAEYFTDTYLGTMTGSQGGTGTINYISGALSVTFNATTTTAPYANYQYENSSILGLMDFTSSATRLAGEGFNVPQDEGGDPILAVVIGPDGKYYSFKQQSVYSLSIADDDLSYTNEVYRRNIGIPSARAVVSTGKGIIFMNTANAMEPQMTILQRNPLADAIEPIILFKQFDFSQFTYTDCVISTYDTFVIVACASIGTSYNDTILLCDTLSGTVDEVNFSARTFATDGSNLYMGSAINKAVYKVFDGFDDDGYVIDNFWISKAENNNTNNLKKIRRLRLRGLIDPNQYYEIYADYDNAGFSLVGTVRGDGGYVDAGSGTTIGSSMVGEHMVGGGVTSTIYPYYVSLKLKCPKHRVRKWKFVAKGFGYVDIQSFMDEDILTFESTIPKSFRQKEYVSMDGTETDLSTPDW